eukprot:120454_1
MLGNMAQQDETKNEEYIPCNYEYEKAVFFWKLNPNTTAETMRKLLEEYGKCKLDYCYIAMDNKDRTSKCLGRAKFKPMASIEDKDLNKNDAINKSRQRAVAAVKNVVDAIHEKIEVDGKKIKLQPARKCDKKEFERYGDY